MSVFDDDDDDILIENFKKIEVLEVLDRKCLDHTSITKLNT